MAKNSKRWRESGNKSVRPEGYAEKESTRKRTLYREDPAVREKAKATAKRRRKEKPETVRAENKAWVANNRPRVRLYQNDYQRNRRANDPEYHQRLLTAQSMWRLRHWAQDPQSSSWVRHEENQAIDPSWRSRLHVWQDNRCYLCNGLSDTNLTIEHLIPRSRGGPTIKQNIVFSCSTCNYSRRNSIWWTEWRPRETHPTMTGQLLSYSTITAALTEAGLSGAFDAVLRTFTLRTEYRKPRSLYVLSTFACSDRVPGSNSGRVACDLHAKDPSAIILFDNEWYGKRTAVLNMLRSKMGIADRTLGARELTVINAPADATTAFLRRNHVMGAIDAPLRIGLTDGTALRGVGVFADRRDTYECVRLAFDGHVPGGMSKIIQGLWRLHGRRPVSSFVDTRYATGDGHETIGFKHVGILPETYLWVFPDRVQHQRYLSNDNKMSRNLLYFDPEIPREDNIRANGIFKIWIPKRTKMLLNP